MEVVIGFMLDNEYDTDALKHDLEAYYNDGDDQIEMKTFQIYIIFATIINILYQ